MSHSRSLSARPIEAHSIAMRRATLHFKSHARTSDLGASERERFYSITVKILAAVPPAEAMFVRGTVAGTLVPRTSAALFIFPALAKGIGPILT